MRPEMLPTGQQGAMNVLTLQAQASFCMVHALRSLMKYPKMLIKYEHYACPMIHLITEQSISSYKKFIHNQVTAVVWQTAFGRDFGVVMII
jgi:hypothetical protein